MPIAMNDSPREDLYRLAAWLAELDRILNPVNQDEAGEYFVEPNPPPPLPPTVYPGGGGTLAAPPGPRSIHEWSQLRPAGLERARDAPLRSRSRDAPAFRQSPVNVPPVRGTKTPPEDLSYRDRRYSGGAADGAMRHTSGRVFEPAAAPIQDKRLSRTKSAAYPDTAPGQSLPMRPETPAGHLEARGAAKDRPFSSASIQPHARHQALTERPELPEGDRKPGDASSNLGRAASRQYLTGPETGDQRPAPAGHPANEDAASPVLRDTAAGRQKSAAATQIEDSPGRALPADPSSEKAFVPLKSDKNTHRDSRFPPPAPGQLQSRKAPPLDPTGPSPSKGSQRLPPPPSGRGDAARHANSPHAPPTSGGRPRPLDRVKPPALKHTPAHNQPRHSADPDLFAAVASETTLRQESAIDLRIPPPGSGPQPFEPRDSSGHQTPLDEDPELEFEAAAMNAATARVWWLRGRPVGGISQISLDRLEARVKRGFRGRWIRGV